MADAPSPRWTVRVLTLFPEMFPGPLGHSLAGKALEAGIWDLETVDIRDFARDKHRTVDDAPFGGGPGMVMRPDVLDAAIAAALGDGRGPVVYLSPRGRLLTQAVVRELAARPALTLLCGRYEGVDERVLEARGIEEISLGDFVLSGGEPAAIALIDAVRAAAARRGRRAGDAGGGEFRTGIAGISPLHPAGRMAGARGAGGAALRPSRTDQGLATGPGGSGDEEPAAGSVGPLCRRAEHERRRTTTMTLTIIQQLELEQIEKAKARRARCRISRPATRVRVNVKVVEGKRERIQAFEGVCIAPQECRPELHLHRAQDLLRRRGGARVPALQPAHRRRSRWCAAAMSAAPSSIICAAAAARRRASPSKTGGAVASDLTPEALAETSSAS